MSIAIPARATASSRRTVDHPAISTSVLMLLVLLVAGVPLLGRAVAQADAAPAAPELRLLIGQAGEFHLDGRRLDRGQLDAALRQARAASPDLRLRIATTDDDNTGGFLRALAAAEHAGVRNIGSEVR